MNLPDKKYAVIYADPPWSYRQCGTGPKSRGNAAQHYNTMTTDDICAMPVKNLAGGSVCFMWATFPQIADALRVMEAWGFEYKTCAFVWIKKNRKSNTNFWGMGAYTRANAEICLLGVTPGFKPAAQIKSHAVHQVIESPVEEHSKKPEETRRRIVPLKLYIETRMWNMVKANQTVPKDDFKAIREAAVNLAVEAIQVAAMAKKFEHGQRNNWPSAREDSHGEEKKPCRKWKQ